jgi:CHAT domain
LYSYDEFRIDISRGQAGKHGYRITAECVKPDGGQVGPTDAQSVTSSITRLPDATGEQRIELGDALGSCLFPPLILAAFHETVGVLGQDKGVRVRLRCADAEMARWPWELARIEMPPRKIRRHLFRDERFSLLREVRSSRAVEDPKERRKLVILTADATKVPGEQQLVPDFPANLPNTGLLERLDLSRPTRKLIDETIDQIAVGEDPLDIFHFTGHGRPPGSRQPGALVLYRDEDRGASYYGGDELARQLDRAGTSLAFVNACYTDDQATPASGPGIAQSLADVVPVVLAVRGAVGDRGARDFADVFYDWLLRGSTVDEAVARGRGALAESLPDWGRVVLYSRASSGRFLEPAQRAAELPALVPQPVLQSAPDGIRRWAMVAGVQGYWQLVPGEVGPEFWRVDPETAAEIIHLRMVTASLALSCDARVVAQFNRGKLALAWVDRATPRLARWPKSFELPLDEQETRLLAVAVDYGDEVICLLSTDSATYRAVVSPTAEPILTEEFDTPTRCATIVAGTTLTVDKNGWLRGWELNLSTHGIAEVNSLDAARSAGHAVCAIAGFDDQGRPVVAQTSSTSALAVLPGGSADEVVVVRQLSAAHTPNQLLLATGGQVERVPLGDAP